MSAELSTTLADPNSLTTLPSKLKMVAALTWPAIMAQMSNIVMEYIDASMVGSLGAEASASIGLVATTTWLFWGLGVAICTGFTVQVAHNIGAGNNDGARAIFRQSMVMTGLAGVLLAVLGVAIGPFLPGWLGGGEDVSTDASRYFIIFSAALPTIYYTFLATSMLRSSGNMKIPGIVNVAMCIMDVVFNYFLIFDTHTVDILGTTISVPGAGLGVAGAATGTVLAYATGGIYMYLYLFRKSEALQHPYRGINLRKGFSVSKVTARRAGSISWPMAVERVIFGGAHVLITAIVAPLGTAAIAANAFAVTAESLCYAPGYGVGDAATTLVGQSLGAGRKPLAISFARICIITGMIVMGILGAGMWLLAPEMMALFTPDTTVRDLGSMALRVEAWAEPLFGAAIVTYAVFVGAGYTKVPAIINFGSIWGVRITLSAILAPRLGLYGVWLAMCIELSVRGSIFLIAFMRRRWLTKAKALNHTEGQALADAARIPDDTFVE